MTSSNDSHPIIIGISGASGSVLASATIDRLLSSNRQVIATATAAAHPTRPYEFLPPPHL